MKKLIVPIPGVALCLLIAVPAWFFGQAVPIVGGAIFAIGAGIVLALQFPNLAACSPGGARLEGGIKFTSKKLLQLSIILLGFNMNFYSVFEVGRQSLYVMVFTLAFAFATAYVVGRALNLHGSVPTLIGVGTAICGGSAIAAAAPAIRANEEEIGQAISTIFLFNIVAAFAFPFLGNLMGLSDMGFGMWAGTAINDTSSVVAAGTTWSGAAGNDVALEYATIVKLTRTLMIIPVTIALAFHTSHRSKQSQSSEFSFASSFPWFVLLFLAAAVFNTFAPVPGAVSAGLSEAGKFVIIMAMGAIGLGTNLRKLVSHGIRPIALGVACWVVVASVSLVVQRVIGIY